MTGSTKKIKKNKVMGAANLGSVGRKVFPEEALVSRPGGGVPSKEKTKC